MIKFLAYSGVLFWGCVIVILASKLIAYLDKDTKPAAMSKDDMRFWEGARNVGLIYLVVAGVIIFIITHK